MDCSLPDSSVHGDSSGKNTGVGCHACLQGIFPTQVSCIAGGFFTIWITREAHEYWSGQPIPSSGVLPDPGIEPGSPLLYCRWILYQLSYQGLKEAGVLAQLCLPGPGLLPGQVYVMGWTLKCSYFNALPVWKPWVFINAGIQKVG